MVEVTVYRNGNVKKKVYISSHYICGEMSKLILEEQEPGIVQPDQ